MSQTATRTTFPKYPAYKDSGVEWLGEIPEGWELIKLKNASKINKSSLPENCRADLELDYVDIGNVTYENGIIGTEKFTFRNAPSRARRIAKPNDTIISTVRTYLKAIDFIDTEKSKFVFSTGFAVLEPIHNKIAAKYLGSFVKSLSFTNQVDVSSKGMSYPAINSTDLGNLFILIPPLPEQTAIAKFLDDKTAKIDRAIAQKEQLIALLKERKQIIIQNAVTKGLNYDSCDDFDSPDLQTQNQSPSPNHKKSKFRQMKDSGVEWIGEIPEHWEVKRLKYVVKILKRIIGYEGPDVLSITQKGIKIKDISSGEGQLAMDYSKYQIINKGEFAMNHMDLLTGYVDISRFDGVISPDYRVFVPFIDEVDDKYLLALFQVGYKSKILYRYGQGVSQLGRWRLPAENFNQFSIPIPPINEQFEILQHIETQSAKIDQAISLQQTQIEKLKEYKATLIDSAVTGKIKVAGV